VVGADKEMTRWLVTGAGGMLGRDLVSSLGVPVVALDRSALDITHQPAVLAAVREHRPDVVVNCAAWTAVDDAETAEEAALAVNGAGPAHLAAACALVGARLVQVSTDYVFDGAAGATENAPSPWPEDAMPAPRNAYGRTKLAGERGVLDTLPGAGYVVRTGWTYGAHGPSFVRTMLRLCRADTPVTVVNDQHGQPTWTADVARQIIAVVSSGAAPGVYHATSSGSASWFELAREVFTLAGADASRVLPVTSAEYPRRAPRPAWSVLGHEGFTRAGLAPIGDWRARLRAAFPALTPSAG
jgi:dTDP-4-dehydrorhamnose reductase